MQRPPKHAVYQGVDLHKQLAQMGRLPIIKHYLKGKKLPALVVRRVLNSKRGGDGARGRAMYRSRTILITIRREPKLAQVLELLLHELVHFIAVGEAHNDVFITRMNRAAFEMWGIRVENPTETRAKKDVFGRSRLRAYVNDDRLVELLDERLNTPAEAAGGT